MNLAPALLLQIPSRCTRSRSLAEDVSGLVYLINRQHFCFEQWPLTHGPHVAKRMNQTDLNLRKVANQCWSALASTHLFTQSWFNATRTWAQTSSRKRISDLSRIPANSRRQPCHDFHHVSILIVPFFTTIWPSMRANTNRSSVSSLRISLTRFGTVA